MHLVSAVDEHRAQACLAGRLGSGSRSVGGGVQAVPALMGLLEKDDQLPKGKLLYVKLGCRGDWPDIQPPEWQPPDASPPVNPVEGIPV